MQRNILSLQPGESAYTPTHAAWVEGSHMYLNGNYPIRPEGMGSFGLRLVKYPTGALAVDLTDCLNERFSSSPSFAGDVPRVRVDFALTAPLPNHDQRRICDMTRDSFGFVSVSSAWLFGPHMWLDGLAAISQEQSNRTPLMIERYSDGTFVIDVTSCRGALFQTAWRYDSVWPIHVLKAVNSRRLAA